MLAPAPDDLRPAPPPRAPADAAALLRRLRSGALLAGPVWVVAAHPDDETLGMGARLSRLAPPVLAHLTDGAPASPMDALRAGFSDREAYARARAAELQAALAVLRVRGTRFTAGLQDQTAAFHMAELALALKDALAEAEAVVTHAYEGGHPDHDAAAFAVQAACALLGREGRRAPVRLEFAGYHLWRGERAAGRFFPDPRRPAVRAVIGEAALARKRAALACFRSQAAVTAWFDPAVELYRAAPDYDFLAPPPPGAALYDLWGWPLTSAVWREQAKAALERLELDRRP